MADYSSLLYLDSDMYVRRDINHLLHMSSLLDRPGESGVIARIGVAHDYGMTAISGQWHETFNSGVILIRPGTKYY